jgi:molecular chaperone DnaJ
VCEQCGGRGQVYYQQGFFSVGRTCPGCRGAGRVIKKPCPTCHGAGQVRKQKKQRINIPPGVDNGTRLRLTGEGEAGSAGGPAGDLYVLLRVREHAIFERHGNDLHIEVPVNVAQAALGATTRSRSTLEISGLGAPTTTRSRRRANGPRSVVRERPRSIPTGCGWRLSRARTSHSATSTSTV